MDYVTYFIASILLLCVLWFVYWYSGGDVSNDLDVLVLESAYNEARYQSEKALLDIDETNRRISKT